jgi:CelD/BcsL family acetyltransferase involved in cellulose biosynthesis
VSYAVQREELPQLAAEWQKLLVKSFYPCAFVSPTWQRVWWEEFGDGRESLLLSVRCGDTLVGVAPLMREDGRLSFAGDTQICDYMDFTAAAGAEQAVLAAVLRSLLAEPWQELALWAVRDDSPTLEALPAVCADLGLSLEMEVEDVCPRVELPDSWEGYLQGLNRKDLHELRCKLRKLPQGGTVGLEVIEAPADVEAALDDFLRLHGAARSDKAAFMTERMAHFFCRIVKAMAEEGLVEIIFLTLNQVRVAGVLCFRAEGELLLYNSGYDPAYSGLSVGVLSKALALQRTIEEGRTRFDFLRGAEPYKYDLGAEDLKVRRCLIRRG